MEELLIHGKRKQIEGAKRMKKIEIQEKIGKKTETLERVEMVGILTGIPTETPIEILDPIATEIPEKHEILVVAKIVTTTATRNVLQNVNQDAPTDLPNESLIPNQALGQVHVLNSLEKLKNFGYPLLLKK